MSSRPDPDSSDAPARPGPTLRGVGRAAAFGLAVSALGLLIARGNPFGAVLVMITIGILIRVTAYVLIRRRGNRRPPWWKWL
jgi:hypothetical protein